MVEQFPKLERNTERTPEEIELEIQALLNNLEDKFGAEFENLDDNWQEKWYYIEMEAKVGKDRIKASKNLNNFLKELKEFLEK